MKVFFFISILFLLIISCNNVKTKEEKRVIYIDESLLQQKYKASNFIDSVSLVFLETKEECLIGDINKIVIQNNQFYILDKVNKSIFIFDKSGKFVEKISRIGRGPGEYQELSDFCFTSLGEILLLDEMSKKILVLDNSYQLKKEYSIPFYADKIECLNDSILAFSTSLMEDKLILWNRYKEERINSFFEYDPKRTGYKYKTFMPYKDKIYFNPWYSYSIYEVTTDSLIEKWYIDVGARAIEDKDLSLNEFGIYSLASSAMSIFIVTESDKVLFSSFSCREMLEKMPLCNFYSKETGKQIFVSSENYEDDITFDKNPPIMRFISPEGQFMSFLLPLNILGNIEEIENNSISEEKKEKLNILLSKIDNLRDTDNPIIAIYHLKEF